MGSRKRPHDETIESGRLQELYRKAWRMLMVTNSFVVIILNSFLLPITEEARLGTSQRTISTCRILASFATSKLGGLETR